MYLKLVQKVAVVILFLAIYFSGNSQNIVHHEVITRGKDTTGKQLPDIKPVSDTIAAKNGKASVSDTVDSPINYKAKDSIVFFVQDKKVFLYGEAQINYKEIELKSDYIEIDLGMNTLYARGVPDSAGNLKGKPHYQDGDEKVDAKELKYNFKTRKAYIIDGFTQQEQGYLHSGITKKEADNIVNLKKGKYTTCNLENPHFYIALTKAKVIPKDKIISGPAYLVIADVPTPIGIPFGFFPNKRENTSGIIIPEYGEENNRGFFLRNGGYYFALSDYFDLMLRGDIYSKGTWGTNIRSDYKKRYKFSGNFNARYYNNIIGEKGLPGYIKKKDFSVEWKHSQDPKANPSRTFTANVNISSSTYDQNNTYNAGSYLSNTKSSSISYGKRWSDILNFSANMRHSQNSLNKTVDFTLPSVTFNMNRQYPFRAGGKTSGFKWYENIEVSCNSKLENRINTYDSLLFTSSVYKNFKNGFEHDIPVSANFKLLKYFTFTPKVNYSGWLYTSYITKEWDESLTGTDTLITDTVNAIKYGQQISPTLSMSFSPTIYGMYILTNTRIKAVRHILMPSVGFTFKPGMGKDNPAYFKTVQVDTTGRTQQYSVFQNGIFGGPSTNKRYGTLSFSIGNNLEMKIKTPEDTVNDEKKIKLLESLSFSTSYDIFKDSMNWSPLSIRGRTTLFKNLNVTFSGTVDPYSLDSAGREVNHFEYNKSGNIGRLTSSNLTLGFSIRAPEKKKESSENDLTGQAAADYNPDYFDVNIPWSLQVDYSWNYSKPAYTKKVTQTLRFSGDVNITPKWKIGFSSGYDFDTKKLTYTTVNVYRDLHCWEMRFNWVPFGFHQMYSFSINVKASVLKDLKWNKQKSWYDNF